MALRVQNQPKLKIAGILTAALALIAQPFAVLPFGDVFAAATDVKRVVFVPQSIAADADEAKSLKVELRGANGAATRSLGSDATMTFSSDSATGLFAEGGVSQSWGASPTYTQSAGVKTKTLRYKDTTAGEHELTVVLAGGGLEESLTGTMRFTVNAANEQTSPELTPVVGATRYAVINSIYEGISAEFSYQGIENATACAVTIHRATGGDVTRTCKTAALDLINSKNGARDTISSPFRLASPMIDEFWDEGASVWTKDTVPTGMTVSITADNGVATDTLTDKLTEQAATYASIAPVEKAAPAVPTPNGPASGKVFASPDIEVKWVTTNRPDWATTGNRYEVRYGSSVDDMSTVVQAGTTASTMLRGLDIGTYYWQVRAVNRGVNSEWSVSRSFVVADLTPPKVVITDLADKNPTQVTFRATDDRGVASLAADVYSADGKTLYGTICRVTLDGSTGQDVACDIPAPLKQLPDGEYAVKANVVDRSNNNSASGGGTAFEKYIIDNATGRFTGCEAFGVYIKNQQGAKVRISWPTGWTEHNVTNNDYEWWSGYNKFVDSFTYRVTRGDVVLAQETVYRENCETSSGYWAQDGSAFGVRKDFGSRYDDSYFVRISWDNGTQYTEKRLSNVRENGWWSGLGRNGVEKFSYQIISTKDSKRTVLYTSPEYENPAYTPPTTVVTPPEEGPSDPPAEPQDPPEAQDPGETEIEPEVGDRQPELGIDPLLNRGIPQVSQPATPAVQGVSTVQAFGPVANPFLNPALGMLFGGQTIDSTADTDDESDEARVLGEMDEQPAVADTDVAATEATDEDGCWSFLGLCWYWWVLIVAALVTVAVLVRNAVAINETDTPGRRL